MPIHIGTLSWPTASPPGPPVSGYNVWFDASQITGVADGTSLSLWPDLGGNHFDASQTTGSLQPLYYKTTAAKLVNGLPAVWFNGSSQYMLTTAGHQFNNVTDGTFTLFLVGQGDGTSTEQCAWSFSLAGSGSAIVGGSAWFDPAVTAIVDNTGLVQFHSVAGTPSGPGQVTVYTASTPSVTARLNGTAGSTTTIAGTLNTGPGQLFLGCYINLPPNGLNGPLCEVVMYARTLNSTEMASVEGYLKAKWGTP